MENVSVLWFSPKTSLRRSFQVLPYISHWPAMPREKYASTTCSSWLHYHLFQKKALRRVISRVRRPPHATINMPSISCRGRVALATDLFASVASFAATDRSHRDARANGCNRPPYIVSFSCRRRDGRRLMTVLLSTLIRLNDAISVDMPSKVKPSTMVINYAKSLYVSSFPPREFLTLSHRWHPSTDVVATVTDQHQASYAASPYT